MSPLTDQDRVDPGTKMLRLRFAEGDRRLVLKLLRAAGAKAAGRAKAFRTVYYDTRREKLRRAGYRLSVRVQGRKRVQRIEAAGSVSVLSAAPCWTKDVEGDAPTRKSVAATPLETRLGGRALGKLLPVFDLDLRRGTSVIDRDGASIVASLDSGTIAAGGGIERICELRLERVADTFAESSPAALFDLARELSAKVSATPTLRSHGENGFQLLHAQREDPGGDSAGDLRDGMTMQEAADSICRNSAAALMDNLALLPSGGGQDALHRGRIGLRRLRAILWFLKPILGPEAAALSGRLRSLAQFLGGARELDVFCDGVLEPLRLGHPHAPGVDALIEAFERRRREAHANILGFGRSPAMLDFCLDLIGSLAALSGSQSISAKHAELRAGPVAEFVQDRLHRRLQAFLKASRHLERCAPDRQHDIRVGAKKLRYAIEAFRPVIGAKRSGKLLVKLTRMQDLLGGLNDARSGHAIALAYALESAGESQSEQTLFAAGLAAAACDIDPKTALAKAAAARDDLADLAR
ncbi:CHAD domain-containing protein [Bosea sp. Root381]|uniref:CYTH and CHAD domain-containing protein n=1 Tax=Bosea sp. Root381 TaxID=1736524 RepID=UPI00138F7C05|nr:CHAD domain-containing protein [Bosea sp. Root381]